MSNHFLHNRRCSERSPSREPAFTEYCIALDRLEARGMKFEEVIEWEIEEILRVADGR